MYYIVGLGNPGEKYKDSRHNAGRIIVDGLDFGKKAEIILPDTYMNKSGDALKKVVTSSKRAEKMIVVHDDIDLPLGKLKIVSDRGSGGHKGVESVTRVVRTKNYIRVRIGIAPTTPAGKLKKPRSGPSGPKGEDAVVNFVIKPFTAKELPIFKKTVKQAREAIKAIVEGGLPRAMNQYN